MGEQIQVTAEDGFQIGAYQASQARTRTLEFFQTHLQKD